MALTGAARSGKVVKRSNEGRYVHPEDDRRMLSSRKNDSMNVET